MRSRSRRQPTCFEQSLFLAVVSIDFLVIFLIVMVDRSNVLPAIYQIVFDSGGRYTVNDLLIDRYLDYAPVGMLIFTVIFLFEAAIIRFIFRRRRKAFDFDNAGSEWESPQSRTHSRNINFRRLTPRAFEEAVAWLITQQTGYQAVVVGGSGDRGADIKVYDERSRLIGIVQCKHSRRSGALAPGYVRELITVREDFKVSIAYLATTKHFSEETRLYAQRNDVRLIDGEDLKHILKKVAKSRKDEFNRLDNSYYEETAASPVIQTDIQMPFRPPASTEQDRIQEQLRQRRDKLSKR